MIVVFVIMLHSALVSTQLTQTHYRWLLALMCCWPVGHVVDVPLNPHLWIPNCRPLIPLYFLHRGIPQCRPLQLHVLGLVRSIGNYSWTFQKKSICVHNNHFGNPKWNKEASKSPSYGLVGCNFFRSSSFCQPKYCHKIQLCEDLAISILIWYVPWFPKVYKYHAKWGI